MLPHTCVRMGAHTHMHEFPLSIEKQLRANTVIGQEFWTDMIETEEASKNLIAKCAIIKSGGSNTTQE